MKFVERHPLADPDAARKIAEIANGVEAVQDGRIYIERVNAPNSMSALLRNRRNCCASTK
jgi:hypothetical protein